jgi:predicted GH43/DUF377 family glycosyl hydrolase
MPRFSGNPVLTPTDRSWQSWAVLNPASFEDGKFVPLYPRYVEKVQTDISKPPRFRNRIGLDIWDKVKREIVYKHPEPVLADETVDFEDPKSVILNGQRYLTVTVATRVKSPLGEYTKTRVGLARINDWTDLTYEGLLIRDWNDKDGLIPPFSINGWNFLIHRIQPNIWVSRSRNLFDWEAPRFLMGPRSNLWDKVKVGIGAVSEEIAPNIFFALYHGIDRGGPRGYKYRNGLFLAEKDPSYSPSSTDFGLQPLPFKIISRPKQFLFEPEMPYEKSGWIDDVVFASCLFRDNIDWMIGYGAGDRCVCFWQLILQELRDHFDPSWPVG